MGKKYHISKSGNVVECRAVKGPCRAQPPPDLEQCHASDDREVYEHMNRQFADIFSGVKRKKFPPITEVTDELIGSPETDVERLTSRSEEKGWGNSMATSHQLWLHDTEERPIAFIQVNEYHSDNTLGICDIEVRPEYRGRKLGKRLIEAVEKKFEQKLNHYGGYTPDGLKSIAPLFKSKEEIATGDYSMFDPMTFVKDWDKAWPTNTL